MASERDGFMAIENELYKELVDRIMKYHPTKDFKMLDNAFALAVSAHKNQLRKSGEPYIIHPLKVAYILADLELDMESIVAGILHDTIEDTPYTYADIERLFGEEVRFQYPKKKLRRKTTEKCLWLWPKTYE